MNRRMAVLPDFDVVIAGAGLAGACAALRLREHRSVCVLERDAPGAGASGVAVGLVNPILGRRARPVWRIDEAVAALDETIVLAGAADLYARRHTLRPAGDAEQADRFRQTAGAHSDHCRWRADPPPSWLRAPHGLLEITTGGAIDVSGFVGRMLANVDVRSGTALESWRETPNGVELACRADGRTLVITARTLILALGRGYTAFPELMRLRLHQVKGQVVRLARPEELPADAPHVSGSGYVASESRETVHAGSTYEHRFADLAPSPRATRRILERASRMIPSIAGAEVLEARAGVRVTVPGIRLPMVGPIPDHRRVWIFSGLGAKGLLTAPLVARELASYLEDAARIPEETRVR